MRHRHAVYSKTIGFPLIFADRAQAERARDAMSAFPDASVHRVYNFTCRESPMLPNSRSAGPGGVFRDQYDREIVLGSAIPRCEVHRVFCDNGEGEGFYLFESPKRWGQHAVAGPFDTEEEAREASKTIALN